MGRSRAVTEYIKETEYSLAKYKAVQAAFSDVKSTYYMDFTAKTVNSKYTGIEFERRYSGLFVLPYCEVKLEHNGKEEIIKVNPSPRVSRLVYLMRRKRT